jgi:hypothetical protein
MIGAGPVVLSSDGEGEFGEGLWEPMPGLAKADFVMGVGKVLDEGVSCSDHSRCAQPFETTHRPQPGLLGCAAEKGSSWRQEIWTGW